MSFLVQHGLHLALVVVPSSGMGTGLLIERRKGLRQRYVSVAEATRGPVTASPPAFVPKDWLPRPPRAAYAGRPSQSSVRCSVARHPLALPAVVVSATGAALTHLVVMPEHFNVSLLYGMFFLGAAILQISWATIVAYRPTRAALVAGSMGCAATIVLWLVSRTVGVPAAVGGIRGGAPEAVGGLDVLATTFELIAVVGVIVAVRGTSLVGGSPGRWPLAAKAMAASALCVTAGLAFWAPLTP